MEENEIIENTEIVEEEASEFNSEDSSEIIEENESITDVQIINAIREVIDENRQNDFEGTDILTDENSTENNLETTEIIDYTQLLIDIKNQQIQTNSSLQTIIDDNNKTIFDKELSEYNITETILVVLVVALLFAFVVGMIKKFTPKIWR